MFIELTMKHSDSKFVLNTKTILYFWKSAKLISEDSGTVIEIYPSISGVMHLEVKEDYDFIKSRIC